MSFHNIVLLAAGSRRQAESSAIQRQKSPFITGQSGPALTLDTAINWCRMVIKGCKGTPALFRATSYEVFHVEVQLIAQVRMRLFFFNNHIRKIGKWRGSVSQFQVRVLRKDPARKRKLESGGVQ